MELKFYNVFVILTALFIIANTIHICTGVLTVEMVNTKKFIELNPLVANNLEASIFNGNCLGLAITSMPYCIFGLYSINAKKDAGECVGILAIIFLSFMIGTYTIDFTHDVLLSLSDGQINMLGWLFE